MNPIPQTYRTMRLPSFRLSLAVAAIALPFAHANAADIAAGRAKHEQVCAACHGKDANSPIDPSYPRLADQYPDYTERALLDYRSGARKNAIMTAQAAALSREDIRNLAAYYASLRGTLRVKP